MEWLLYFGFDWLGIDGGRREVSRLEKGRQDFEKFECYAYS